jgi:spermidine synthase
VRLLHVDLYDHEAAAPVLDDEAFYAACRRVLDDGGVMSVNLFGRHASFAASAARIAAAFGADQVWSLRPTREGNTVVVAGRAWWCREREELLQRAPTIEQRFGPGPAGAQVAAHGAALRSRPRPVTESRPA